MKTKYSKQDLDIMHRVRKGKKWLEINIGNPKFEDSLKIYEQLVDSLSLRGITEAEAWCVAPELVEHLTDTEIEKILEK
jgi:hypothetical protein